MNTNLIQRFAYLFVQKPDYQMMIGFANDILTYEKRIDVELARSAHARTAEDIVMCDLEIQDLRKQCEDTKYLYQLCLQVSNFSQEEYAAWCLSQGLMMPQERVGKTLGGEYLAKDVAPSATLSGTGNFSQGLRNALTDSPATAPETAQQADQASERAYPSAEERRRMETEKRLAAMRAERHRG